MTEQLEVPQLREAAERLGEARQPGPTAACGSLRNAEVASIQHQLLEAPRELPDGIDVGLGSVGDALDDERAQPASGDDGVPQRHPERLENGETVEATTNPKFG